MLVNINPVRMIVSRKIFKDKKSFIAKEGLHLLSKQDNSEHQASVTGITPMPSTFQFISNSNMPISSSSILPVNVNPLSSMSISTSMYNPNIKPEN